MSALLLLLLAASARADMVFLNAGQELEGRVLSVDARSVRLLEPGGAERVLPRGDVLKVKLVKRYDASGDDPELSRFLRKLPAPGDFPDEGILRGRVERRCVFSGNGGSACSQHELSLVLHERGKDGAANSRLFHLDGYRTARIVHARALNGGKVSVLDDASVQTGSEYPQYPHYDRMRSTKFSVPDVATGSVVDLAYDLTAPVALSTYPFIGQWHFRSFEPTGLTRLQLVVPAEAPIKYAERGLPPGTLRRDGGVYTWEVADQPPFKQEPQMPPYLRIAPAVTFAPADDWPSVARKAAAPIEPLLKEDLSALAAQITRGKAEKVEALYNWVVSKIRFQNVPMDDFGYVPRAPSEILRTRGGNALDKPFLLFCLLRAAGLEPSLVYLENKTDSPFEESVPSIRQLSVAAVRVEVDGKPLFLSPIEDTRRYDDLGGWLQGVHGLVLLGPGAGTLVETPLAPAEEDAVFDEMELSLLPDGGLRAASVTRARGGREAGWRDLKDMKKDDLDRYFERMAHGLHPTARLLSYSAENLDDLTKPVVVKMAFASKEYALTASGGYLAFRLPWISRSAADVGAPTRETALFWHQRDMETTRIRLRLPPGYSVYHVPESLTLTSPETSFRGAYRHDEAAGTLEFSQELRRDAVEIPPSRYAAYKEFREKVALFGEQWIVLKKTADVSAGAKPKRRR